MSKIKRSNKHTQDLQNICKKSEKPFLKPVLDTETRWNSTLHMLKFAGKLFQQLKFMCFSENLPGSNLFDKDGEKRLEELISFLEKLEKATNFMQGDK